MFTKIVDLAIWVVLVSVGLTVVGCYTHLAYKIGKATGIGGLMTYLAGLTTIAGGIIIPMNFSGAPVFVGMASAALFGAGFCLAAIAASAADNS